jgi:DNA-binding transcriptional regulator YiaG
MPEKEISLATRLKSARAKLGLTQLAASRRWQLSVRSLQGWETGKEPKGIIRQKLERILGRVEK